MDIRTLSVQMPRGRETRDSSPDNGNAFLLLVVVAGHDAVVVIIVDVNYKLCATPGSRRYISELVVNEQRTPTIKPSKLVTRKDPKNEEKEVNSPLMKKIAKPMSKHTSNPRCQGLPPRGSMDITPCTLHVKYELSYGDNASNNNTRTNLATTSESNISLVKASFICASSRGYSSVAPSTHGRTVCYVQ